MIRSKERWKAPLNESRCDEPLHDRSHRRTSSVPEHTEAGLCTPATVVGIPALSELEGDSPKEITPTEVRGTPLHTLLRSPRPNAIFSPLSPSIYSRNTDGASILPNDSVMSFDGTDDGCQSYQDAGSAVIITSHAVKSYIIGTPSPRNKTDSIRSSKDWKAWLSHEVSELGSPIEGDMSIHEGYTPSAKDTSPSRHHRELADIEDDTSTVITRTSICTRSPSPQPEVAEVDSQQPAILHNAGASRKHNIAIPQENNPQKLVVSPLVHTPAIRKDRHSSARSHRSAQSRSSVNSPRSSAMNDRFPFIDTGRRTSIMSARYSRSSRSATDSGSSTGSKGTPMSKVYSDLSAPVTVNWAPQITLQDTPKTVLRENNDPNHTKHGSTEHAVLDVTEQKRPESKQSNTTFPSPPDDTKENRHKIPSNPLEKSHQRASLITRNTPATEYTRFSKGNNSRVTEPNSSPSSPHRQRMRVNRPPLSPIKLTMRPKSAFELRNKGTLPATPNTVGAQATKDGLKRDTVGGYIARATHPSCASVPMRSSMIDQDTLHMLLEAPWAISGPPSSPRSSLEATDRSQIGPKLHIKHSSSTLALHREPSPGLEEQTIDTIIDERTLARRNNLSSVYNDEENSVTGRTTPGQRMAERFLRERTIARGSGAGTPCSETERDIARTGAIGMTSERADTPAFL